MSVRHVSSDRFEQEVLFSDLPVVVDFFADWCGPCKMIAPVLEDLALSYQGQCHVVKVNVDENHSLASQYQVSSIPTLLFMKNGQVVDSSLGVLSKQNLNDKIKKLISS